MGNFAMETTGEKGELIMSGALTIVNASGIKAKLIEILKNTERIVMYINKESDIDLSFLQLLCSAHRTASKLGKSFLIRPSDEGKFLIAVENAGYARRRGCARDRQDTCLWVGGNHA